MTDKVFGTQQDYNEVLQSPKVQEQIKAARELAQLLGLTSKE